MNAPLTLSRSMDFQVGRAVPCEPRTWMDLASLQGGAHGLSRRSNAKAEVICTTHRQTTRAFTLIELLVVIAIISILAAFLLPVLGKAKDRAVRLTDISNLKQQTVAMHLYVADNGDALPWPNWFAGDVSDDGVARSGWLYTLDIAASGPSRFKLETGLFWPTLHQAKLYLCPRDDTTSELFLQREQRLSSYVVNGAVCGYKAGRFPCGRLSRMAPDAIAFWETDERYPKYCNDGSNYPHEGVSTRHNQGAINANFSGAVSYIKYDPWYDMVNDPNKNLLWCYPDTPDGREPPDLQNN